MLTQTFTTQLCLIVESGTDVRLVEGLAERFQLTVLARAIRDGVEISGSPRVAVPTIIGPVSRFGFAFLVAKYLMQHRRAIDCVMVQGYGLAALAANLCCRINRCPAFMLVCSPAEAYYRCRTVHPVSKDSAASTFCCSRV